MTGVAAGPGRVHGVLDALIARFAEGTHRAEALRARAHYFTHSGQVFDDDAELFETRMAAFAEWYVLEWPVDGRPAVLTALAECAPADQAVLTALATSHRSLFHVDRVGEHEVELEDLLGGARFIVAERRSTAGFELGQIVEARLVWDGERVVFARTFLFHPREAREAALDLVDRALEAGRDRDGIMFHLARLHLRWYRGRNVPAERIYAAERPGPEPGDVSASSS
jgi:hypothetical protein